jgi:hypothetical protein
LGQWLNKTEAGAENSAGFFHAEAITQVLSRTARSDWRGRASSNYCAVHDIRVEAEM